MFWLAVGLMFSDDWYVAFKSHHIRDLEKGSLGKWGLQKEDILLCVWEDSAAALICSIPTSFHPSDFLGKGSLVGLFQRNVEPWRFAVEAMVLTQCAVQLHSREQPLRRAAAEKPPHPLHVQLQHGRVQGQPHQMKSYSHSSGSPVQILNCKHQLLSNSRLEKGLSLKHPAQSTLS